MANHNVCWRCKGNGHVEIKVKNLATLDYNWAIVVCVYCNGKGNISDEDKKRVFTGY